MKTASIPGLLLLAAYLAGLALFGLDRPFWGDESHFYRTVLLFESNFSLETLLHYEEMSTPLPFGLYAGWGALFGTSVQTLRLLSLLIAAGTFVTFYRTVERMAPGEYAPLGLTACLAFNPYTVGLSLFIFPDMLTLLFVLLMIQAIHEDQPVQLGVASALGLLCKQYAAFMTLAAFIVVAIDFVRFRERRALGSMLGLAASVIPVGVLFLYWGGFSPDNSIKELYLDEAFVYHPNAASLYLILLFLYPLPVVVYQWRAIYADLRVLLGAFLVSWVYFAFPVRASASALQGGVETVGFTHRLLERLLEAPWVDAVFFVLFFLSLPVCYALMEDVWRRLRRPAFDRSTVLHLALLSFMIVMPLSYLTWEKYFLPVLPAALIGIYGLEGKRMKGSRGIGEKGSA